MTMTLTNEEIFVLIDNLSQLSQISGSLPVKAGFAIIKNIKALVPFYESIIETREKILEEANQLEDQDERNELIKMKLEELSLISNEVDLRQIFLSDIQDLKVPFEMINNMMIILAED